MVKILWAKQKNCYFHSCYYANHRNSIINVLCKNSNIDKMYIYEIDNNKNEVTIIRYINDELESEKQIQITKRLLKFLKQLKVMQLLQ